MFERLQPELLRWRRGSGAVDVIDKRSLVDEPDIITYPCVVCVIRQMCYSLYSVVMMDCTIKLGEGGGIQQNQY